MISISSRDFNQDIGSAKKASLEGAVVITDRGVASHVLLSFAEYERLTGQNKTMDQLLSNSEAALCEFEPPRFDDHSFRAADLE